MKKQFQFHLDDQLYQYAEGIISQKYDVIKLLLHTAQFILRTSPVENPATIPDDCKLVLFVNRLFFGIRDKIFTIHFPFHTQQDEDSSLLKIVWQGYQLDHKVTSLLLGAIADEEQEMERQSRYGMLEDLDNYLINQDISDEMGNPYAVEDWVRELLKYLVLSESGYFRYDYDPIGAEKHKHPEKYHPMHHLDVFFSSGATMKMGLSKKVTTDWIIDLADTNAGCKYISESKFR